MPKHIAEIAVKALNEAGKVIKNSKVLIMGLTYKENVADTRETPVRGIIKELKEFGIDAVKDLKGMDADCVIMAVAHNAFKDISLRACQKITC